MKPHLKYYPADLILFKKISTITHGIGAALGCFLEITDERRTVKLITDTAFGSLAIDLNIGIFAEFRHQTLPLPS